MGALGAARRLGSASGRMAASASDGHSTQPSASWSTSTAADALRAPTGRCAAIVGGGLSGLATAAAFASRGYGVLIVDASGEPGSAPASSAAAGLLDPLAPKGKLMWRGVEALDAARRLLDACSTPSARPYAVNGVLHVPRGRKDAAALREAATGSEHARLGITFIEPATADPDEADPPPSSPPPVPPLSPPPPPPPPPPSLPTALDAATASSASEDLDSLGTQPSASTPQHATDLESLACGAACPDGALLCRGGMVVDVPRCDELPLPFHGLL